MATARLIVTCQYCENYGDVANPYWKCKGGTEYQIATLTIADAMKGEKYLQGLVDAAALNNFNDYTQEYVICWGLFWDGEQTADEEIGIPVTVKEVA